MLIPHETHNKQKVGRRWIIIISLMCLLIIFLVGISANCQQPINAGSIATSGLEPIPNGGPGQAQDIEKQAGSTDKLAAQPSIWPVSGAITSAFGSRTSPMGEGSELHQGIDIANSLGTPIVATADGQVVQSRMAGGYGNMVEIDHGNGFATIYGHNSRLIVTVGQSVRKGQVISYLGSTGYSTGPHVHYEVRVNGTAVDPISFMVRY